VDTILFTQNIVKELECFLKSSLRNKWLYFDEGAVYVRKSQRCIEGSIYSCLDLATIEIEESLQRQGLFKLILTIFHKNNPFPMLLIENVINPHLYGYLIKQPNVKILSDLSFYILKEQ
jgi:hypothetical protein